MLAWQPNALPRGVARRRDRRATGVRARRCRARRPSRPAGPRGPRPAASSSDERLRSARALAHELEAARPVETSRPAPASRRPRRRPPPTAPSSRPRTSGTAPPPPTPRSPGPARRSTTSPAQPPQELLLVDDLDAELLGLGVLRPGFSPATTKSVFFDTLDATRAPASWRELRGLARGSSGSRPPGEHDRRALERLGARRPALARSSAIRTPAARSFSISARFSSSSNHSRTVAAISGPISGTSSISSSVAAASASIEPNAARQHLRDVRPDVADVEPHEQPPDRPVLRPLDRASRLVIDFSLKPGELRELLGVERVDVGRVLDEPPLEQRITVL